MIGAADHRALGGMDVGLGVILDPALVAAVFGGVHRGQPGTPARRAIASAAPATSQSWEWIEVEADPVGDLLAEHPHVLVHRLHPAHERLDVLGERRLGEPVHDHPVTILDGGQ